MKKFNPLSSVPASTDERTVAGVDGFRAATSVPAGEGVRGVLKGWAAEVDVAAGG